MKQKYKELSHNLCWQAAFEFLDKNDKFKRRDVMREIGKYAGISPQEILAHPNGDLTLKNEALDALSYEMENRIEKLNAGDETALELEKVTIERRRDGMTGKVRNIAYCCVFHQLFGHLVVLGLKPLFNAVILPQQYASIPNRGPLKLARYLHRLLRRKGLNIRYARKTDIANAYGSTSYSIIIDILEKLVPSAVWIINLLKAIAKTSIDGNLIIGGYLDAWLFNFLMSYVIRYLLSLGKLRRDKFTPFVSRAVSHMDDFGILSSRLANLNMAIKRLAEFLSLRYGLKLKTGKTTEFLTIEEEKAHKKMSKPAARGCPSLDIGGYVVHRTYTTIRKAIFLRARRQYLRAETELKTQGFISRRRAYSIVSYFGYFKNSNSRKVRKSLNVDKLFATAKHTISHIAKLKNIS